MKMGISCKIKIYFYTKTIKPGLLSPALPKSPPRQWSVLFYATASPTVGRFAWDKNYFSGLNFKTFKPVISPIKMLPLLSIAIS